MGEERRESLLDSCTTAGTGEEANLLESRGAIDPQQPQAVSALFYYLKPLWLNMNFMTSFCFCINCH